MNSRRLFPLLALVLLLGAACTAPALSGPYTGSVAADAVLATDVNVNVGEADSAPPAADFVDAGAATADATVADDANPGPRVGIDQGPPSDQLLAADLPSRTTTLRVHYPAAMTISVRGSGGPLSWNAGLPMARAPDGTFSFTIDSLAAALEWKPLVDDTTWSFGPNYTVQPGQTVDVYPHFFTEKGRVTVLISDFTSQYLTASRTIWAYLPASYDENTAATFPVVYMHDGQNLFDPALAFGGNEWRVDETMDAAADSGTIAEAVVIGVGNTADRIDEYTPTADPTYGGGGGDKYLSLLALELKPTVDAMLRTRPEREATAIVGSSLGGLISAYGGVKRPETFGLLGALSPSTWWDSRVLITEVLQSGAQSTRPLRVYVDSGDSGDSNDDVTDTADLAATYRQIGYQDGTSLSYLVQPGGQHNEIYWAQRLPGALEFLLGPRP